MSFYDASLSQNQLPYNSPLDQTGPVRSSIANPTPLCLDDWHAGTGNANIVDIYTCNNGTAQQWTMTKHFTAEFAPAPGMCLDAAAGGTANGTKIILWPCTGYADQVWHLESDGQLWNPVSGRCLDDPGSTTAIGTQLQLYDCNFSNAQNWIAP